MLWALKHTKQWMGHAEDEKAVRKQVKEINDIGRENEERKKRKENIYSHKPASS